VVLFCILFIRSIRVIRGWFELPFLGSSIWYELVCVRVYPCESVVNLWFLGFIPLSKSGGKLGHKKTGAPWEMRRL
jgi:hypothetical protein